MPPLDERPRMEAKLPLTAASNKPAPFQENAIINIILQSLEIHIAKKKRYVGTLNRFLFHIIFKSDLLWSLLVVWEMWLWDKQRTRITAALELTLRWKRLIFNKRCCVKSS